MAAGRGLTIEAIDYNSIRAKVTRIWGVGAGTEGYGQTLLSSDVTSSDNPLTLTVDEAKVTEAQWDQLRYDVLNTVLHQTGALPVIKDVAAGTLITFGSSDPVNQYDVLMNTAIANKFTAGTGRTSAEPGIVSSSTLTWSNSVSTSVKIQFANANQARYFFNSGGKIRFESSRTGGSGSSLQNSAWSNLLSTASVQEFSATSSPVNFYNLTTSPQQFYTISATSPYSQNNYSLSAYCDVSNNASGGATYVVFVATWHDGYTDPPAHLNPPPDDVVDGTLTLTVSQLRASGDIYPVGTLNIVGPSYSILSGISGS